MRKILAIESSCDESAVAIFDSQLGIVESLIDSQVDLHALYGGVVPDLASRQHLENLPKLVKHISKLYDINDVDEVVCTVGPGLANCLAMGISSACALAMFLNKPLKGVNHLKGHAYSAFINLHKENPKNFKEVFKQYLPHLGLITSGGNTILFEIDEKMNILAQTLDDAAGEALDKGAKLLDMPYPGAALIEKLAMGANIDKALFPYGQNRKISENPDFSFSGLKTSLRYYLQKLDAQEIKDKLNDICASYQYAVIEQLRRRSQYFVEKKQYKSLGLSGGVSNNKRLCEVFEKLANRNNAKFLVAPKEYRGDNAGMIAFASWLDNENTINAKNYDLKVESSMQLI